MAYLSRFGDLGANVFGGWRRWLPGGCALCRQSASGWGLCEYCHQGVLSSRMAEAHRCKRCDVELSVVPEGQDTVICPDCKEYDPVFDSVVTVFDYVAPVDLLIHQFKTRRQFFLAPMLAEMLWCAWQQRGGTVSTTNVLLTAVPASRSALLRRGFNPATELARYVSKRSGWQFAPALLARTRQGHRQATLGRAARREATVGLYEAPSSVAGRSIVVVDDVVTTGSTLDSIARSLYSRGAMSVWGLALARTPPERHGVQ